MQTTNHNKCDKCGADTIGGFVEISGESGEYAAQEIACSECEHTKTVFYRSWQHITELLPAYRAALLDTVQLLARGEIAAGEQASALAVELEAELVRLT
jgi:hypothetical protein